MDETFFRTLNYSSVNEDWRTEAAALRPQPGDTALCVTGSGQRPLDLLAAAPMNVMAVDLNPVQSHLLHLKVAALRRLSFDDYTAFLGLRSEQPLWRRARLKELGADLPPDTRRYWNTPREAVGAGVLYQGRWETFHHAGARLVRRLHPQVADTLFAFENVEAQSDYVDDLWSKRTWSCLFRLLCARLACRLLLGDPAYCQARAEVGAYLFDRLKGMLHRRLARDSFMVSLALHGRLSVFDLPPHLTPEGAALIRERLDGLTIATADVLDVMEQSPAGTFSRFSLSDMPSFLDAAGFQRLLRGVQHSAAPEARFCIRELLAHHEWPAREAERLRRESALERQLEDDDRSFAYSFLAGEVLA
jgi:S-adenosylmethionine-diacylglycerol 3-amino-3-carboxypropyl transferase